MIGLAALLLADALACPTIATGTPNGLTYDVARTSIVRQGNRTTFTVSINPVGQSQDFALVMPVPEVLGEDDVAVLDASVFATLEATTGLLTMADAGCSPAGGGDSSSDGDGGGGDGGESGSVHVEAQFVTGDYLITILSASESQALFDWLDNEGYHLAEPTIPILEDYISEGMYFMAAKVLGDATGADGSSLPPLQVAYDSEVFTIPIKLAARNSPGQQDMLIYAITDQSSGLVGVSNYTEFEIEDQCIWGDPNTDDFQAFYEGRFNPAWEAAGQAGWTVEWAGGPWDCSPCSGYQLSTEELSSLGFVGEYEDHFLSRLHMRYTDTTASQDLMLYESGMRQAKVTSFADDNSSNRDCIAMCDGSDGSDGSDGGSDGADGGSGGSGGSGDGGSGSSGSSATPSDSEAKSGCATTGGSAGWPAALGGLGLLLALGRRRRE